MIERLSISNFRCIRQADLDLGPLTVLVGPNASGKTTVLRALDDIAHNTDNHWRKEPGAPTLVLASSSQGPSFRYDSHRGTPSWLPLQKQTLRLDVDKLRSEIQVAKAGRISESGGNLANVVGSLTRKQQDQLSRAFCGLVPVFSDIDLQPTREGRHELRFQDRWSDKLWYRPSEVSDGTMLMLAFLTLQYQSDPVELITIEEPDRGLHPYLMEQVIAFFRRLSSPGIQGVKPIQIVATTHSAELIEYCRPEEVRFLDRNAGDGSLKVHKIDTTPPDWKETFDAYRQSLGGVWLSGGVGGVPRR